MWFIMEGKTFAAYALVYAVIGGGLGWLARKFLDDYIEAKEAGVVA